MPVAALGLHPRNGVGMKINSSEKRESGQTNSQCDNDGCYFYNFDNCVLLRLKKVDADHA